MTFEDATDEHPTAVVTVKVYEPVPIPVMVVVAPVPVDVTPPGFLVIVQVPVEGKPFNTTLPVETAHVGCVINPITGAPGRPATTLITILEDDAEVHPEALVTV
jgi:hypothetical protein